MGRSHRLMSSLKLLASPPIDLATSSSSVHVMRSAEGPFSVIFRRAGADVRPVGSAYDADYSSHSLSYTFTDVYGRPPTLDRAPMTLQLVCWRTPFDVRAPKPMRQNATHSRTRRGRVHNAPKGPQATGTARTAPHQPR